MTLLVGALVVGGVLLLVCVVLGVWLLAPSLRIFRHFDFDPTRKDDASVYKAEHSDTRTGGGGAGMGV